MIRPLDKNILIVKYEEQNPLGIYLPTKDNAKYKVIALGSSVIEVKVNDLIIVDSSKLTEITYQNEKYYLVKEENVLGIMEE